MAPEDEARLTSDAITAGVEEAREALNAPPLDLLAFEAALKQKHDQLQAAGITPVLPGTGRPLEVIKPKNKHRVPIAKQSKK